MAKKRKKTRAPGVQASALRAMVKSNLAIASVFGEGVRLGAPGSGVYVTELPAGDKTVPLGLMFYNPENECISFSRTPGVDLDEFISVIRLLNPYYGMTKEAADALRLQRAKDALRELQSTNGKLNK